MYNPMMGMGYGSYGMMSPFYGNSMYSSSLMFGFGSGYYNGFGSGWPSMSYGYSSYYGMNSFYGGYNSFYNPYAYNYGNGYKSNTIVTVDNPRPVSSRNQEVDRYYSATGRGGSETGRLAARATVGGQAPRPAEPVELRCFDRHTFRRWDGTARDVAAFETAERRRVLGRMALSR